MTSLDPFMFVLMGSGLVLIMLMLCFHSVNRTVNTTQQEVSVRGVGLVFMVMPPEAPLRTVSHVSVLALITSNPTFIHVHI